MHQVKMTVIGDQYPRVLFREEQYFFVFRALELFLIDCEDIVSKFFEAWGNSRGEVLIQEEFSHAGWGCD